MGVFIFEVLHQWRSRLCLFRCGILPAFIERVAFNISTSNLFTEENMNEVDYAIEGLAKRPCFIVNGRFRYGYEIHCARPYAKLQDAKTGFFSLCKCILTEASAPPIQQ